MEGEAKFADVILPACTNFERWDIGEWTLANGYVTHSSQMCNHRIIVLQHKAIEPLGESKSDYEIFRGSPPASASRACTPMGRTELDWVKATFDATDLPTVTTWDEFVKKGYYVVPRARPTASPPRAALVRRRPGARHPRLGPGSLGGRAEQGPADAVRQDRVRQQQPQARRGLGRSSTPSGRSWGRSTSPAGKATARPSCTSKYPLQLIMPHPRYTFHTHNDAKDSWTNEIKDHRVLHADGRYYWIMRLTSKDAAARGIATATSSGRSTTAAR